MFFDFYINKNWAGLTGNDDVDAIWDSSAKLRPLTHAISVCKHQPASTVQTNSSHSATSLCDLITERSMLQSSSLCRNWS